MFLVEVLLSPPPHPLHGSSPGFRDGPFAAVPTKSYTFLLALIISSFIRPSLKLTCSSSLSFLSHMFVFSLFFYLRFLLHVPFSLSLFSLLPSSCLLHNPRPSSISNNPQLSLVHISLNTPRFSDCPCVQPSSADSH